MKKNDNEGNQLIDERIVIGFPEDNEFKCPNDGVFPNLKSGCSTYYICKGDQVY